MRKSSVSRLLTRHFLRRFFDNDLISPHIDLHENAALICAAIASTMLFLSVLVASFSLFGIPTPGPTAIRSLGDNFFLLGTSMLGMALVAAMQWDALSLDARDTANLGPLPITRIDIIRAKLTALVTFATGFAAALNLMPTVVYESLLVAKIPVGLGGLVRLVVAHAVVSMLASAFGFVSVVALRELLRALMGQALFSRISTVVQALVVLACISALLLLPGVDAVVSAVWSGREIRASHLLPPLWFLGLQETIGGGVIANVQGLRIPAALIEGNNHGIAAYRATVPLFRDVAQLALLALAATTAVAVLAYAWNARRLPQPARSAGRRARGLSRLSAICAAGDPVARAGFTFGVQALLRSASHRISMAAAAALAVALAFVLIERVNFAQGFNPGSPPHSILGIQTAALIVLLGGFRHAVRLPAELRANWVMQIAWRGSERRFLSGVKRAAVAVVAMPTLLVLLPFHMWLFADRVAVAHLVVGALFSILVVEALFAGIRSVPFASAYVPAGNVKTLGPIVLVSFFYFLWMFTFIERVALQTTPGLLWMNAVLIAAWSALRFAQLWRRRGRPPVTFDEPPEAATEWLGLSG